MGPMVRKLNIQIRLQLIISACLITTTINAQTGILTGKILDAASGNALTGVNISVINTVLGTTTDIRGNYTLSDLPVGRYSIRFSMIGYETQKETVVIESAQTVTRNIQLKETAVETPNVVVTASKRAQRIEDSPASISVVTARDIEQKNQVYLNKVLEHVPGVNFMGNQINIRGSSGYSYGVGSRVLLLVDGVPVMSSDNGDIKWDMIPAGQIKRVEVVKSAGSALYGSSALGGVINVITKEPARKSETWIRLSSGFYDDPPHQEWQWSDDLRYYNDVDIDHSLKLGIANLYVSAGRHASLGYRQNSEYTRYNTSAKMNMKLSNQSNVTLSGAFETGDEQIGLMWWNRNRALEVEPPQLGDYMEYNRLNLNSTGHYIFARNFRIQGRLSWFRNHFENFMHDNADYSTANRYGMELQGHVLPFGSHAIIFGTEETWDYVASFPLGHHNNYTISGYLQDEFMLLPTLNVTTGVRYDYVHTDIEMNDEQFSPKLGLVWHITDLISMRMSSGKGFRSPSISERFPDVTAQGLKIIPNLYLKPERAWTHEIGISTPLARFMRLELNAFRNEYWDLIEPTPDQNNIIQFVNVTRARISGVESAVNAAFLNRRLTAHIGYTYLDPRDLELKETLAYRSRHMWNVSMTGRITALELGFDYRYYEKIEVVKVYPIDPRVAQNVLDIRANYNIGQWNVGLTVNNLFNHMHTQVERTILPPRHYTLTLRARL